MKKIKLFSLAFVLLLSISNVYSKQPVCRVIQRQGDGSSLWQAVNYDFTTDREFEIHTLSCALPGPNQCIWPTDNGKSPCDGGVLLTVCPCPPDITVTDDNGKIIPLDITVVNKLILDDINIKNNRKNFFLINANVGVYYTLTITGKDIILETKILTGKILASFLKGGF